MPLFSKFREKVKKRNGNEESGKTSANGSLSSLGDFTYHQPCLINTSKEASKETVVGYFSRQSRLCKTLHQTLADKNALAYFIQYMEVQQAAHLIKFWLDADSFQASTRVRLRTCSSVLEETDRQDQVTCNGSSPRTISDSSESFNIAEEACKVSDGVENCAHKDIDDVPSSSSSSPLPRKNSTSQDIDPKFRKSIERDTLSIYSKYISQDAPCQIGVTDEMRNGVIAKICCEDGQIDPDCFVGAQEYVLDNMRKKYMYSIICIVYCCHFVVCVLLNSEQVSSADLCSSFFPAFINSEFHCKYQIDVLTSTTVLLTDILYSETAMFYFMEYLEKENATLLLEFWMSVDNFRQLMQSNSLEPQQAQADAIVLYEKYFSLQASCPLGFDDTIRFKVEADICGESGTSAESFDAPCLLVLATLENVYLADFLTSQLYLNYLSEMMTSVQKPLLRSATDTSLGATGGAAAGLSHRRQGSTASDVSSVGSSNTLLASTSHPTSLSKADKVMEIEADRFNPDSLWQRPLAGSLSLGRVDAIGKFETLFEPEPFKKAQKETVMTKVKKFVTNEEDKAKEDMAWQVAQMILRDVANTTAGDEDAGS